MRAIFLAFALLVSASARAEDAKLPESAKPCFDCHDKGGDGPEVDKAAFLAGAHARNGFSCTDCHEGVGPDHAMGGVLPKLDPAQQATVDRLAKAEWPGVGEKKVKVAAPRAYLSCANCHPEVTETFAKSIHSRWLASDRPAAGPTCQSCHGSIHAVKELAPYAPRGGARVAVPADRREIAQRCESCHGNEEFAKAAGLEAEVAKTYHDSIHGRLVRVGNHVAPACMSCHAADRGGTHAIVSKDDPASPVAVANRKDTCARCHPGATDNFAKLVAHKPLQEVSGHIVPHLVHIAFSWLTTMTLLFFAFHVLIDFVYELRMRVAKRSHPPEGDELRSVVRFDIHQRIQHWFMLSGVILLGITGWPLRGAGSFEGAPLIAGREAAPYSAAFLRLFGGAEGAAIWHRVGAVLIITSSIYHLVYLTFLAAKKRLPLSMLPTPKDAFDMRDNILFMLGVNKERPKFDRFMYLEKFDYWAVFWGIVMMVGTGFVFWFPVFFAEWAPSWVITAAQIIHGEEATLAILFLFVVHFYNVHLKPSIFPMNWAWLNGRITVDNLKHEHPLEYERLKPDIDE
jgi:cytochrome b subunit of formate dehydrogenase/nitrate/TMAO reductase-like tetraheme cytochrome c subunit